VFEARLKFPLCAGSKHPALLVAGLFHFPPEGGGAYAEQRACPGARQFFTKLLPVT